MSQNIHEGLERVSSLGDTHGKIYDEEIVDGEVVGNISVEASSFTVSMSLMKDIVYDMTSVKRYKRRKVLSSRDNEVTKTREY
jgi:hypothetical protein